MTREHYDHDDDHDGEHDDDDVVVRPYLLTGGRTTSTLPIEAIVAAVRELGDGPALGEESQAILALCGRQASAVAEVSAHLKLPLGVARVLIADLVEQGWLRAAQTAGDHPDISLVERLISGLRAMA
jgi:hypothetical protein